MMIIESLKGTAEDMDRQARRQVRVTKEHKSEVQRLLKLMGIPYHDVSTCMPKSSEDGSD